MNEGAVDPSHFEQHTLRLQEALREPVAIQELQRFAPELSYGRHFGPPAWDARQAAVAVLIYWNDGRWFVPMTLRPSTISVHAGQVSFAGGSLEIGETTEQCALREYYEELGDPQTDFHWAGLLKPIYVFNSNYVVAPHVALARRQPVFRPNPREVAAVLEVPLTHLMDAANHGEHWVRRGGVTFRAPHYEFNGHQIWGATAIMLSELLAVIRRAWPLRDS